MERLFVMEPSINWVQEKELCLTLERRLVDDWAAG